MIDGMEWRVLAFLDGRRGRRRREGRRYEQRWSGKQVKVGERQGRGIYKRRAWGEAGGRSPDRTAGGRACVRVVVV
jgi:hypothetical protein